MSSPAKGNYTTVTGFDIVPVTLDADLATPARALRCKPLSGESGTVRVTTRTGEVRTTEIEAGERLDLFVTRVHSAGTTASGLEAII